MKRVNLAETQLALDPADPDGYRAAIAHLGRGFGAEQSGTSLYELPTGQAVCPYHYEHGEEEWLLVLQGRPSVRTPEGTTTLAPLDLLFFPRGPEGAHQVRNDAPETARVVMWSTVVFPAVTVYPDSDKVGIYVGDAGEDLILPRSSRVEYFHGET